MPSEGVVYRSGKKLNSKRKSNLSLADQIAQRRKNPSSIVNHSARSNKTTSDLDSVDISHLTKHDEYKRTPTPLPTVIQENPQRQTQQDRKPDTNHRGGLNQGGNKQTMPHNKNEVKQILPPVYRHPANSNNEPTSRLSQPVTLPPIQDNNKITLRNNYNLVDTNKDKQDDKHGNTHQTHKTSKNRSRSRSRSYDKITNSREKDRSRSNSRNKTKARAHSGKKSHRSRSRSKQDVQRQSSRERYNSSKRRSSSRNKYRERSIDRKHRSRDKNHRSISKERRPRSKDRSLRSESKEEHNRNKSRERNHRSKSRDIRPRSKSYDKKYRSKSRERRSVSYDRNHSSSDRDSRRSTDKRKYRSPRQRRSSSRSSERRNKNKPREDTRRRSSSSKHRRRSRERRNRSLSNEDRQISKSREIKQRKEDDFHANKRHGKRSDPLDKKKECDRGEKKSTRHDEESYSHRRRQKEPHRHHLYRESSLLFSDEDLQYKSKQEEKHQRHKSKSKMHYSRRNRRPSLSEDDRENVRRHRYQRSMDDQYSDEYTSDDSEITFHDKNIHKIKSKKNIKRKSKGNIPRQLKDSNGKVNVIILKNGESFTNSDSDDDGKTIYIRSKSQHTGRINKKSSGSKDYYSDVDTRNRIIDRKVIYYHDVETGDNVLSNRNMADVQRVVMPTNTVNQHRVVRTEPDELFYLVPVTNKPNNTSNQNNMVYVNQPADRLVTITNPTNQNNRQMSFQRQANDLVYGQEPLYDEYRQPVQQKFYNQHTNHYRHNNGGKNINITDLKTNSQNNSKPNLKNQNDMEVQCEMGIGQLIDENAMKLENMQVNNLNGYVSDEDGFRDVPVSNEGPRSDSARSILRSDCADVGNESRISNTSRVSTAEKRRALRHLGELSNYNIDIALGKTPLRSPPLTDENLMKKIFNDEFQAQMDEYLRS